MSLQDIIDWWNGYVTKKRKVVSCGIWPTAVPPQFDIFLKCCVAHDQAYCESEYLYAQGVISRKKASKLEALNLKQQADNNFIICVRSRYSESFLLFRPFAKAWGEQYISLVLANGDRVWFHSIGVIIAEMESGNHPVIKLALRRANNSGSKNEKKAFKQAYSQTRTPKDGN